MLGNTFALPTMPSALDPDAIAADWRRRGFGFGVWIDPPGQTWRDFVHPTDELVMLAQGELELTFAGRTLRPAVGEEVIIPAGASHTVRNVGSVANRWFYGYRGS
jgi:mannose-6-phosphate isomerase-like protein (cupin superfamily)